MAARKAPLETPSYNGPLTAPTDYLLPAFFLAHPPTTTPPTHRTLQPVPLQLLTKLSMLSKGTVTPAEATVYEGYKTAVVRFETEADAKVGALQWLRNGGAVPFCSGRVGIIGSSATLNLL